MNEQDIEGTSDSQTIFNIHKISLMIKLLVSIKDQ
jgi:hypothetical protein